MKQTELRWQSFDGLRLYIKVWDPEKEPRALINLVHGLGDHINRYNELASAFVDEGYALIGMDLRGHGQSEGKRGHTPSYETLMGDLEMLRKKSREKFPGVPDVLFGQSLGGNLVINYALRSQEKPHCIVASSPWLRLSMDVPKVKLLLARTLSNMIPGFIQPSGLNPDHLSRDQEVVRKFREDPLVHDKISLKLGYLGLQTGEWALENAEKLDIPLLLIHGDSDKITSHLGSQEFAEKAKGFTTLKIWDGGYHELHNDTERLKIIHFVQNWIRIYTEVGEPE